VRPYLFIDAGGTLVFPNSAMLSEILREHAYSVAGERLDRAVAGTVYDYDEGLASGRRQWNPHSFFEQLLERAGIQAKHVKAIAARLEALNAQRSLWSTTYPWVRETLSWLATHGYRMSIISNADGRVAQEFARLGLAAHFEAIFDSHVVGYSKPDARIFQHAMSELGLQPEDCIYVGDMYYVDVLGANRAGMAGLQVDRFGLYGKWPGMRIPTVAALPDLLSDGLNWQDESLFPLRGEA